MAGFGDVRAAVGFGVGLGFEFDGGAQLGDGGGGGELGVVLVGSVSAVLGDDADLVEGQLAVA